MKLKLTQLVSKNNLREEIGELSDLSDSLKEMNGNIQPIIVCKTDDENIYEILSGSRRYAAAKSLGLKEVDVCVKNPKNEYEKFLITFHENIGRKDLTWQEQDKALKLKSDLAEKFSDKPKAEIIKDSAKIQNKSERTVYRQLKAAEAIEKFPELAKEKTRDDVLKKVKKIESLDPKIQDKIAQKQLSIEKLIKEDQEGELTNKKSSSEVVINVLKEEVKHYKEKAIDSIIEKPKDERIKLGIFLKDEVNSLIIAARSCEGFGIRDMDKKICKKCEVETEDIANKCIWVKQYFKD